MDHGRDEVDIQICLWGGLAWLRTKRTIAEGLLAILANNGGWMSGTESEVWAKAQPEGMVNEEGVKRC